MRKFVSERSEEAFTEIARRHGGMVFGVCRRSLPNHEDAEDAAQAVFLLLAKKAAGLPNREAVAGWLYRAAQMVSLEKRRRDIRRREIERKTVAMKNQECESASWERVREELDAAISGLPKVQREAVVMAYLEGMSQEGVARELAVPLGTVKSRLSRGLEHLREKLLRRGVVLPAAALGAMLIEKSASAAAPALVAKLAAAGAFSAPGAGAVAISSKNILLMEAVMKTMIWAKVKVAAAVLAGVVAAGVGGVTAVRSMAAVEMAKPTAAEAGTTVLEAKSYWRFFGVRGPGVVPLDLLKAAKPEATAPAILAEACISSYPDNTETPPPSAHWAKSDFDDSAWPRAAGPFPGGMRGHAGSWRLRSWGLVCLRGKFAVQDPAAVKKLTLTMKYAGGVAVHLNGREVYRQDLPAGEIGPEVPALPYPQEAYVDAQGKILPVLGLIKAEDDKDRVAKRDSREVKPIALPVQGLLKGMNVLAVEVHRAAFRPEALLPAYTDVAGGSSMLPRQWPHIGLNSLRLAADAAPGAIEPNLARPKGLQVWNEDPHREFNDAEYSDCEKQPRPIRLVGARNGFYSGLVVAGSDAPIEGLKATVSELKGAGTIPAADIRVRYAQLSSVDRLYDGPLFTALEDKPPAKVELGPNKGAVQPVWVTVKTPRDAPAGKYQGTLEVSAAGAAAVKVPVDLEIVDWTVPDPTAYRQFMSVYESPESVAMQYDVPLWSEEHWKRLEKSVELLGYFGNNFMSVPLACRTELGNDESMVTWVKKADGSYDYDFTTFDRYLDLMTKYCKIKIVSCMAIYECAWVDRDATKHPFSVTVVDPATKKREMVEMPQYATEGMKKQWKMLLEEIQARLKKKGLEGAMVLSSAIYGCHESVQKFFKEIAPGVLWHSGLHGRPTPGSFAGGYRYSEWVYVPHPLPAKLPLTPRYPNDGKGLICIMMPRFYDPDQPPISMRSLAERSYLLGDSGAGRILLDYWPVWGDKTKRRHIFDRWPGWTSHTIFPHLVELSVPGKEGAVSTPKIEALREGLQETEARFFIEDALTAKKVGGELAERCQKILDSRVVFCRITHPTGDQLTAIGQWPARAEEVYRLAAEVAGKIGGN
ncbi:MAG: glycoside hydrolase domain-containing protein [Planctomycetota bacterium]